MMKFYQKFLPYIVAIATTSNALILTIYLEAIISRTIGAFFYIAIIFTTWYGGFKPGIVSIIISTLAIDYFFIEPRYNLWLLHPSRDLLQISFFIIVSLTINLLTRNLQQNQQKIERLNQQLVEENAEQLRMALSAANMGMWDWDLVTGKIIWSREHALLLGLDYNAFDGKYETFDERVHPDDRQALTQAIQQALQTKSIYNHEFRIIWIDGSIHWMEGRGQGFYNSAGEAVRMIGTIMNIDDRKQAQILRHEQFEQQRILMEISGRIRKSLNLTHILQTTVEEVRHFFQCDRALIFKINPDDSGKVIVESIAEDWEPISLNPTYDPCVGKEYIKPFEQGLITAKSDIYTAKISPCHRAMLASFQVRANLVVPILQNKNLWGLLIVHQCETPREWKNSEIELLRQLSAQFSIAIQQGDLLEQLQNELKERKKVEISLQENEQKLQLFIKYAPASIIMFDREMRYIAASQRWIDDLHLPPIESLIGRSHYDVFPNLDERLIQSHQRGLAGFIEKCDEYLFNNPNGLQQWFRWEVHPWYFNNGEIGGIILCSEDITERKNAELALKQSELTLKLFFQYVPAGVAIFDRNLHYILASQRWINDYNLASVEAIIGRSHYEIFPEIPEHWKQIHQRCLAGASAGKEEIFIREDGSSQWVRWEIHPWYKANQEIGGISIFSEDITQRKQAEINLQKINNELEKRVIKRTAEITALNDHLLILIQQKDQAYQQLTEQAQLLDLAHDSIITWDANSLVIKFWNQGSESMYGWTKAEAIGQEIHIFLKTQFSQSVAVIHTEILEKGYWEGELIHFTKDNEAITVSSRWVIQKDKAGRANKILEINNNITDRKKSELDVKKYIYEIEDLYNNAPCGYHSLDAEGTIIRINDTELQWLGYTRDEVLNTKNILDLLTPESQQIFYHNFPKFKQQGWIDNLEFEIICKNGSIRWVNVNATAIKDDAGKFFMSRSTLFDITERKHTEEVLQQYERIVSNANDGIALINRNYIYQIVNLRYLNWRNKPIDEIIGNNVRNVMGEELFENFIQPRLYRCFAGEKIEYERWFEYNVIPEFCSVTYTPYRDIHENITGIIVSIRNITKIKQIELALSESEEKFRQLAENIQDVFWMTDIQNKKFIYVSPAYQNIWQQSCEYLYQNALTWLDSIHPEDRSQIEAAYIQQQTTGLYDREYRIIRPDSSIRWIRDRGFPIREETGKIIRMTGIAEDITDRKQTETILQQKTRQEQLLWCITQAIRQSLDLTNILNTAVTQVRQTLQTDRAVVYRFNPDWSGDFVVEAVGNEWIKLVGTNICRVWDDTYLQETEGGRFRNRETFVVPDIYKANLQNYHIELLEQFQAKSYVIAPIFSGESLWGLLAIYQNTKPRNWESWEIELLEQIASQLAIAIQQSALYTQLQIELHERKQTEAILRETERRWRFLIDNVQLFVVGLDINGNINYINPFYLQNTGYTEAEVLGQNWFDIFIIPDIQEQIKNIFSEMLITSNGHYYYQNKIITKFKEEKIIAWNNTLLKNSEGNIIGTISIGEDITERQKIEQIKNDFIGIVSHELRTPLTAIRASLGLLQTGIYNNKPDKFKRMIDIAANESDRLVRLVNDILDLERLDSGRAFLDKTTCKAADLIQQAVEGVRSLAHQENITLVIEPTDAEVWASNDSIIQTLTNLLSNAIKFSAPNSRITLLAQTQENQVLFQVSDQGRGIPPDKLEAIFGRFQQVDASDSRQKGGTGLGLAICRSIIKEHGGKIWAESSLNMGSTFFFTLSLPPKEPKI